MKRFKYKYERLLNLKEIEEKKEYAELSRIRNEIEGQKQKKEKKRQEIDDLRKKVDELEFFNVEDLRYYSMKNRELENEIVSIDNNIEKLKELEIKQNDKVVEIRKNRKILEKLKEKHKMEFFKQQNNEINSFMDELANQRFNRKKE
jgi:flagellar FliJ protein